MPAVLAEHRGAEIRDRFGVELREIPVACLAHRLLATQFIKLQNQAAFVLLRHQCPPRRRCRAASLARRLSLVPLLSILEHAPAESAGRAARRRRLPASPCPGLGILPPRARSAAP